MSFKFLRLLPAVVLAGFSISSCDKMPGSGGHSTTKDGLEYDIVNDTAGTVADTGDFISFHLTFRTPKDSILNCTRWQGQPYRVKITKPVMKGGLEDGFTLLSVGDSANFWIPVDSLMKGQPPQQRPAFFPPGSKIAYGLKVIKIETKKDIEQSSKKMEVDQIVAIEEYGKKNGLTIQKTASGLHYAIIQEGSGAKAMPGDTVSVHYTGTTLAKGEKFDSSRDRNQPFEFPVGMSAVIPGWDEGFQLFTPGTKAILLIPSKLAYGENGAPGSPIGPNSALVFDIELLAVKPVKK